MQNECILLPNWDPWPTGGHLRHSGVIGGATVWVMSPGDAQGFVFAFRGFYLG